MSKQIWQCLSGCNLTSAYFCSSKSTNFIQNDVWLVWGKSDSWAKFAHMREKKNKFSSTVWLNFTCGTSQKTLHIDRVIQRHFTRTMSVFYLHVIKVNIWKPVMKIRCKMELCTQVYLLKTAVLLHVGPIDLCCSGCALLTLWTCSVVQTVLLQGLVRKWGGSSRGNWPLPEGTESPAPEVHDTTQLQSGFETHTILLD